MFFMEVMLGMLDMQGMRPHNVQEQTQSSHPKFQDFQTLKIDQAQKIPEMSGMLGMQPAGQPQKSAKQLCLFLTFPKINHQKQIPATPLKYPKNKLPKSRCFAVTALYRWGIAKHTHFCKFKQFLNVSLHLAPDP